MLDYPVTGLRGIGAKRAEILRSEAGIETVEDLLYYIPRRYIDRSSIKSIRDCEPDESVTIGGKIIEARVINARKKRLEVWVEDDTDTIAGVFFGRVEYFRDLFGKKLDQYVLFSGKVTYFRNRQMVHPEYDFIDVDSRHKAINTARIIPLYHSTETLKRYGFDSRGFRKAVRATIDDTIQQVTDSINGDILARLHLIDLREALFAIHYPDSFDHAERARRRLAFNEILFYQYYISLTRRYIREKCTMKRRQIDTALYSRFLDALPFPLTDDQRTTIEEIMKDMAGPFPMNRLIQGDVGSGKTAVAMAAVLFCASQGRQAALMAPTEILSSQHVTTFKRLVGEFVTIENVSGSMGREEKEAAYERIRSGAAQLAIGTHALIEEAVRFKDLGLIIIDEQHRFGVEQRSRLRSKGGDVDIIIMSATPIPRSLALTLYGDLDISTITTMPANRKPITTLSFPVSRIKGVYNSIEKYISQGRQIYYVLPVIDESESLQLKSAIKTYENLSQVVFRHRRVALLHGRLKQNEKDDIMRSFKDGSIDILVSTTVIEVGIDVPNANVIIIEHAERFGLAQLHQLRGRVGRGEHESFCVLILADDLPEESLKRLDTLVRTSDGFVLAEEDLKQRGGGDIVGTRQHGHPGNFEFVDLLKDVDMIGDARREADRLVDGLNDIQSSMENMNSGKIERMFSSIRTRNLIRMLS